MLNLQGFRGRESMARISLGEPKPRRWADFETSQGLISPSRQRLVAAGELQEQYSVYSSSVRGSVRTR